MGLILLPWVQHNRRFQQIKHRWANLIIFQDFLSSRAYKSIFFYDLMCFLTIWPISQPSPRNHHDKFLWCFSSQCVFLSVKMLYIWSDKVTVSFLIQKPSWQSFSSFLHKMFQSKMMSNLTWWYFFWLHMIKFQRSLNQPFEVSWWLLDFSMTIPGEEV